VSPDVIAMSWVLSYSFVDVALSGDVTSDQLRSNIDAIHLVLSEEEQSSLSRPAQAPESYWAHSPTLEWS
jgi:aryl-alcohol dehydrogenase-like predicted oxidoreductase